MSADDDDDDDDDPWVLMQSPCWHFGDSRLLQPCALQNFWHHYHMPFTKHLCGECLTIYFHRAVGFSGCCILGGPNTIPMHVFLKTQFHRPNKNKLLSRNWKAQFEDNRPTFSVIFCPRWREFCFSIWKNSGEGRDKPFCEKQLGRCPVSYC